MLMAESRLIAQLCSYIASHLNIRVYQFVEEEESRDNFLDKDAKMKIQQCYELISKEADALKKATETLLNAVAKIKSNLHDAQEKAKKVNKGEKKLIIASFIESTNREIDGVLSVIKDISEKLANDFTSILDDVQKSASNAVENIWKSLTRVNQKSSICMHCHKFVE